jgi:hypothetical protein
MSLEDLPRASLSAQPEQEKRLIAEEGAKRLLVDVNKLTDEDIARLVSFAIGSSTKLLRGVSETRETSCGEANVV